MLKAAVVGATGYTGEELVKILAGHPKVKITSLSAKIDKPTPINELFPALSGKVDLICREYDLNETSRNADLIFLAVPHGVAMKLVPPLLNQKKIVIDLSADFRLKKAYLYLRHYGFSHHCEEFLGKAVYGLPELYRESIKKADLIANPGCFPTAVILGILPLVKANYPDKSAAISVDAKTGLTGGGRKAAINFLFAEVSENIKAYKVGVHQHQVEMEEILSRAAGGHIKVNFVPHLIPVQRGILSTIYLLLKEERDENEIRQVFQEFYKQEPFVQVLGLNQFPETRFVRSGNFCQIGLCVKNKTAIIITAIDNLVKGAAGQAVQNMNIRFGFREKMGLVI